MKCFSILKMAAIITISTESPPASGEEAFNYLTSEDVKINLALIGSLPFNGITQVRIHWLLDLIHVRQNSSSIVEYNFQYLDELLEILIKYGLRPGFELMGNPGKLFSDINNNNTQVDMWKQLITAIASRYIDRFGVEEVMKWKFETWNEPDLKKYNILNFTLPGYLRYFKACRSGLDEACAVYHNEMINKYCINPVNKSRICFKDQNYLCHLKLGGPAGLFKNKRTHNLCWGLLNYCKKKSRISHLPQFQHYSDNTSDKCSLDFLSFHKKGDCSPRAVVKRSKHFYNSVKNLYHSKIPLLSNNEADILKGWWQNEKWRSDVHYASAITQVLIMIYEYFHKSTDDKVLLISNDNAFLNYDQNLYPFNPFNQRTLLARFIMKDDKMSDKNLTYSQFFQKPVYIVMGMLAYLYNNKLNISYNPYDERLHVIATSNEQNGNNKSKDTTWSCSLLVVYSDVDNVKFSNMTYIDVKLKIYLPKAVIITGGKYVVYTLDNALPHPADVWAKAGRPLNPDMKLRALMRQTQGPHRTQINNVTYNDDNVLSIVTSITLPSVSLIHICQYIDNDLIVPGKVTNITAINVTLNEVLLLWDDDQIKTRCIKTYKIEFCHKRLPKNYSIENNEKTYQYTTCNFKRINKYDVIFPSFQFGPVLTNSKNNYSESIFTQPLDSGEEFNNGFYRISAIDYWDRQGSYSDIFYYG
ncbi:alpha-L-iduronidase isoform X2 [Lycorma delicatula]|uniref:alpha-L-iduronidase isoform X2 n=1 Tax=Lycorma delicatula TaxID=130591 RepID=UPI003F519F56